MNTNIFDIINPVGLYLYGLYGIWVTFAMGLISI